MNFVGVSPTSSTLPYYLRVVDPRFGAAFYDWGSGPILHGPPEPIGPAGEGGANSHIRATLPAGTRAVGTDIMSFLQYASPFRVVVSTAAGDSVFVVSSSAHPIRAFVGIVSRLPITSVRFHATNGFPVLDNFGFGSISGVGPPRNLVAVVTGATVDFTWMAPAIGTPTGYVIEAAITMGGPVVASLLTVNTNPRVPNVPDGTYFVHARAVDASGTSPPSNVVHVTVGGTGPSALVLSPVLPVAPGQMLSFSWSTIGAPGYTLSVTGGPGITGPTPLGRFPCCGVSFVVPPGTPAGNYAVVVSGSGVTSQPITVTVTGGSMVLTATRTTVRIGEQVAFSWTDLVLGPGNTYTLFVAGPGSSSFGPLTFEPCCIFQATVPPAPVGVYNFYVRAINGAQSNTIAVTILP